MDLPEKVSLESLLLIIAFNIGVAHAGHLLVGFELYGVFEQRRQTMMPSYFVWQFRWSQLKEILHRNIFCCCLRFFDMRVMVTFICLRSRQWCVLRVGSGRRG